MIILTQIEFTERTGISLVDELREGDVTQDRLAETMLERWAKRVYKEINKLPHYRYYEVDEKLSEGQIEDIKQATADYGLYVLRNGDLSATNGVDEKGIKREVFPSFIIRDLKNHGLIFTNTKGRWY